MKTTSITSNQTPRTNLNSSKFDGILFLFSRFGQKESFRVGQQNRRKAISVKKILESTIDVGVNLQVHEEYDDDDDQNNNPNNNDAPEEEEESVRKRRKINNKNNNNAITTLWNESILGYKGKQKAFTHNLLFLHSIMDMDIPTPALKCLKRLKCYNSFIPDF